jgi:hypothetical protein
MTEKRAMSEIIRRDIAKHSPALPPAARRAAGAKSRRSGDRCASHKIG